MKPCFTFFLFLLVSIIGHSQVVQTFFNTPGSRVTDALLQDAAGNLYGADYSGTAVYRITPHGESTTFATGFNTPNGLAFDSDGNLFVCDNQGNRIYKLDSQGSFLDTISVFNPSGIIKSMDSDTMIFTQYQGDKLNKLTPDGLIIETHSGGDLNGPVGLAYDDLGQLYVGNFDDREIYRIDGDELVYIATVPGPSSNGWLGFITYGQGVLWGTNFGGHDIYKIYPSYTDSVSFFAGGSLGATNGPIDEARFNQPNGILASTSGDTIFVSEFSTGHIRMITDLVSPTTEIGSAVPELSVFPNPSKGVFNFRSASHEDIHLKVYTMDGRLVRQYENFSLPGFKLDLSPLPAGQYQAHVIWPNGSQQTLSLIRVTD